MDLPVRLPTSLRAGMMCRCPRCSQGPLFSGFLEVAPSCDICGLDYGFADPADGPAFFVMTGIGILVMGGWAWWAVAVHPPAWQQYLAILVGLLGGCLATLRPVKAWLIAEQFVHKAGEGHWISLGGHGTGGFVIDRRNPRGPGRSSAGR